MWETPFKSGELLMEQTPSQPETLVGETPLLLSILVTVFVILALLELRNFLHVAPFLWDSVFRPGAVWRWKITSGWPGSATS